MAGRQRAVARVLILVVNSGSSSLKYTLFDGEEEKASGLIEKIGEPISHFSCKVGAQKKELPSRPVADHEQAIGLMMEQMIADRVISRPEDIFAVGHRVVHGGPDYTDAALVDDKVRHNEVAKELAPLHKPNYTGMDACVKMLPHTPQVAVFDTAFHQTMPAKAYIYALPYRFYTDYKIRRYGFHGTSHKYVSARAAEILKKSPKALNLITLHLGNGSSLAAVAAESCVDTSMGLTPLAGVVMGSRTGDMDPAIVPFIMEREKLTPSQMDRLMNKESGILGLSGVSNDLREVIARAESGDERSRLALDVFAYSVQKYIGAYHAILGGAHALVFTAGIGEKSPYLRELICRGLKGLGVKLDPGRNQKAISREMAIQAAGSKIKVLVVPTREEYMIARETLRVIKAAGLPLPAEAKAPKAKKKQANPGVKRGRGQKRKL
jgi:acetate kinase